MDSGTVAIASDSLGLSEKHSDAGFAPSARCAVG